MGSHRSCLGVWLSVCRIHTNLPLTSFSDLLFIWRRVHHQGRAPYFFQLLCYREVLTKCLLGELDCQDDDVIELLSSYKCFKLPTKDNIKALLVELAHQEIIPKPRYVAHCWAPIISALKTHPNFCNVQSINELFLGMKPNAKKVIKALHPEIRNESEQQSFDFLKKFIKSLDPSSLKGFLKFVTGSDVLLKDQKISISFYLVDGLGRRPVAHTCGPLLEVPCTYQSYNELAEEFTNIMREKEAWTFSIV